MPAIPFINKTSQTRFEGTFNLDNIQYEYTFYLQPIIRPLPKEEQQEIINYFGNRMFKGKICLEVDEETVTDYLKEGTISAFVMVKPVKIDNIASGSLQILNRCYTSLYQEDDINFADVWISDVCRVSNSDNKGNPLKGLFFLMEQLAVQNMEKPNINLYVDRDPSNISILQPKYEGLGFVLNIDDDSSICPDWDDPEMMMTKSNLVPHPEIIDLSFLKQSRYYLRPHKKQRTYGGKKKTRRKRRKRSLSRKNRK